MEWKVPYSGISNRLGLEEAQALVQVLQQDRLAFGPKVGELEEKFAHYLGVNHAVVISSCTAALHIAAQLLGLQKGDEVITTPQTFWATIWPLLVRKCQLRFADIDSNSLTIDPDTIERLITAKTKAIYVVHYGGQAVDMNPVMEIARKHNLPVVEDCAHAPGAKYKGRYVGTIGDIGCFSLNSLKNMTAGEGGILVTNDDTRSKHAKALGWLGAMGEMQERPDQRIGPHDKPTYYNDGHARDAYTKDYVDDGFEVGHNYRLSELAAVLGLVQLGKLDKLNERRRQIAHRLNEGLQGLKGISLQEEKSYAYHVYHLYTIFYHPEVVGASKDDFIRYLEQEEGIEIVIRYFPVHLLPETRALGHCYGECPVAEKMYFEHQIQLPIFNHMSDDQIEHMIEGIHRAIQYLSR
jgi:perosamine synthetase